MTAWVARTALAHGNELALDDTCQSILAGSFRPRAPEVMSSTERLHRAQALPSVTGMRRVVLTSRASLNRLLTWTRGLLGADEQNLPAAAGVSESG